MTLAADPAEELTETGAVSLPTRRRLESALVRTSGLSRQRVLTEFYRPCFDRVEPRWRASWPANTAPADLVRWAVAHAKSGDGSSTAIRAAMGRVATLGDDLVGRSEWDARVAWVAVGVARAALRGTGAPDHGTSDLELDLEDYDPPALAACIEASALPVPHATPLHTTFWRWWLENVVTPALAGSK